MVEKNDKNILNQTNVNASNFNYLNLISDFLNATSIIGGIKIGLFDLLENQYLSCSEIKKNLSLKCFERNLVDFLDKLYVCNHLDRIKEQEEYKYTTLNKSLLKSNDKNLICFYLMLDRFLMRMNKFPSLLVDGKLTGLEDTFDVMYNNEESTESFLRTMANMHEKEFKSIIENFKEFETARSVLDIGGGIGLFSVLCKRNYEHLNVFTLDLPVIKNYVEKFFTENNLDNKINIVCGDMFNIEAYPKVDVCLMCNLTNDWNHEKKIILFKNAYECLNENGVFLLNEELIEKERSTDSKGLNLSFYMFIECSGGFNITFEEVEKYAQISGFKKVVNISERFNSTVIACYK